MTCTEPDVSRLTDFQRGKLTDANSDGIKDTVTTAGRTQVWDLDALGNWDSLTTDGGSPAIRPFG